jgi:hypothetical protein
MASSQNANRILQMAFAGAMADTVPRFGRVGRIVSAPGVQSFKVGDGAFGGTAATMSRTATSVSLSDWFTFEASHTMAHKVIKHQVPVDTVKSDYALETAGRQMAEAAVSLIDKEGFDAMEALFSLAHPRAGGGAGQVGAGKKFLDTGLAFLQGEAGAGTQDNLLTAALSESSLNSAIKLLLAYRHDRGRPLHIGTSGGLKLVVDPFNAQVAHELVTSMLSGADNASNFIKGLIDDIIVYPFTTDADDWFLVDGKNPPIGLAIASEPTARISTTTDGLFAELVAEVSLVSWTSPYEPGIVGSNVA